MDEGADDLESDAGSSGSSERRAFWETPLPRRKRKKSCQQSSQRADVGGVQEGEQVAEFKVVLKLIREGASFGTWSPIKLTSEINKLIGDVRCAKTLRDGSLLVICNSVEGRDKALKVDKISGQRVVGKELESKKLVSGVISGIPPEIACDEIKANLKGGKVVDVRRLKVSRGGERVDSFSVLVKLDETVLPDKVYIGFMSYGIRQYIPPPLRCFKCQRFGHVAALCKGKQRCGRCAGEHEYGKCEVGAKVKCCNCGGEHSSAYGGCEVSKRAAEVQKIKVTAGVSYAEAAKQVPVPARPVRVEGAGTTPPCEETRWCSKVREDTLLVEKRAFLLFLAEVVNCAAQAKGNTERIKIIVRAADKRLGLSGIGWESVVEELRPRVNPHVSQSCSAGTPS